eukprot:9929890-Lingulodinium_polyedra.AAC.1
MGGPESPGTEDLDMIGWAAEDILLYLETDKVSVYHSLSFGQDEDIDDIPREYTTVMPHVGDMEPAYPLAVEPIHRHGAVEIGWPCHLAMLLPEVKTPTPEGY